MCIGKCKKGRVYEVIDKWKKSEIKEDDKVKYKIN